MAKELKIFSGRGQGKYLRDTIICYAFTKSEAARLIQLYCCVNYGLQSELKNYFQSSSIDKSKISPIPTSPSVYVVKRINKINYTIKISE